METTLHTPPGDLIKVNDLDRSFASDVMKRSGVNFNKCYHCKTCAGGCPFYRATDYHPNSVIRMVQLGLKREALESSMIWVCVGCHTCAIQCPQAIDMSALMDGLRQIAIAEGVVVAEPDILNFHRDVLHSIKHFGRTHKLEVMLRYKLRKWDLFSDTALGMKMFAKRKLHIRPSKVKNIDIIRRSFQPQPVRVAYE